MATSVVALPPLSSSAPAFRFPGLTVKPSQETTPPFTPPIEAHENEAINRNTNAIASFGYVDHAEEPLVAVLGCGYVGTNLINEFSSHYNVIGFDIRQSQIKKAKQEHEFNDSRVAFTLDARHLTKATHFLVSVPTLLIDKKVDTSYIESALSTIAKYARAGSTVVIESSVEVGMTRYLAGPLAEKRGFFVGMSPERVDPGRTEPPMHSIPKVISGLDDIVPGSLAAITQLYQPVFKKLWPVCKPEAAEMTKLFENCQRMVNIAFVNEMADACIPHDIDPYEVCEAAATKPFGYLPFKPSLGVGGHCIPVNPYYLLSNCNFPLLEAAAEKMRQRPAEIGQRILDELFGNSKEYKVDTVRRGVRHFDSGIDLSFDKNEGSALTRELTLALNGSRRRIAAGSSSGDWVDPISTVARSVRVLVVGVGFKPGQAVLSNSPGLKLLQYLADSGRVEAMFADPLVKQESIPQIPRLNDDDWNKEMLETFVMIIVAIKQEGLDFDLLWNLDGVKVQRWSP